MIIAKSIFAGFLLGIPIGPLGALALKRMLLHNPLHGIFFGIGFAIVDMIYTVFLGFGLHLFFDFILQEKNILFVLGSGLFLILGCKTFFQKPQERDETGEVKSYFESTAMAFFLAMFSPATFFAFFSVFGSLRIFFINGMIGRNLLIVLSVVAGGFFWWVSLSLLIYRFKDRMLSVMGNYIHKILGSIMFLLTIIFSVLFFIAH